MVEPHPIFGHKTKKNTHMPVGWGLFLPEDKEGACVCMFCVYDRLGVYVCCVHAGWTEELTFEGPHVLHIAYRDMEPWQKDYAIADTFKDGMVFAPDSPSCVCKLFRVQHDDKDPSHELAQRTADKCVLVPLRKIAMGGELTFDYFGSEEEDMISSSTVLADSSTDPEHSFSLSSSQSVGGSQVVLTGNGLATTARLMALLEDKMEELGGEEVCEDLAF